MIPQRERLHGMLSVAAGSGYWQHNASPLRYYVLAMWYLIMPLGIRVAGYFPGARMRVVGDLPRGVAEQWRKWCLHAEYLGAEGALLKEELSRVSTPICALSMQDDEMMTLAGTRALFALYPNAELELRRVRPSDYGVPAIGHFGFFRTKMRESVWPIATDWIDRTIGQSALPAARLGSV
jgi:predicted alpha/beta hydrolase